MFYVDSSGDSFEMIIPESCEIVERGRIAPEDHVFNLKTKTWEEPTIFQIGLYFPSSQFPDVYHAEFIARKKKSNG